MRATKKAGIMVGCGLICQLPPSALSHPDSQNSAPNFLPPIIFLNSDHISYLSFNDISHINSEDISQPNLKNLSLLNSEKSEHCSLKRRLLFLPHIIFLISIYLSVHANTHTCSNVCPQWQSTIMIKLLILTQPGRNALFWSWDGVSGSY